jgi:hypothetical protein
VRILDFGCGAMSDLSYECCSYDGANVTRRMKTCMMWVLDEVIYIDFCMFLLGKHVEVVLRIVSCPSRLAPKRLRS